MSITAEPRTFSATDSEPAADVCRQARIQLAGRCRDADELRRLGQMLGLFAVDDAHHSDGGSQQPDQMLTASPFDSPDAAYGDLRAPRVIHLQGLPV